MKVQITPEMMVKIWKMHLNNNDPMLIADVLGISITSARRVIQIMSMAQNGEDIDSVGGTNHQKQKLFAKKFFGIPVEDKKPGTQEKPQAVEETEPHRDSADEQNVATFMLKVTVLLEEQNELLKKFLSAFGVSDAE